MSLGPSVVRGLFTACSSEHPFGNFWRTRYVEEDMENNTEHKGEAGGSCAGEGPRRHDSWHRRLPPRTKASLLVPALLVTLALLAAGCAGSAVRSPGVRSVTGGRSSAGTLARRTVGRPGVSGTSITQAVEGGRFVERVAIGGLTVTPLAAAGPRPLGLDARLVSSYVGITGGLASGVRLVGYGSVTLRGVVIPRGTPPISSTPAWVGIAYAPARPVLYSCPAMHASSPVGASAPYQPIDTAVIFYAAGGDGAVLYSTGGSLPCGGEAKPTARPADGLVSVPWKQVGPSGISTTVSYLAPTCASLVGVDASGNARSGVYRVDVTVAIPFDRSGCSQVVTRTTTVSVYPQDTGPGAPPPPPAPPPATVVLEHSAFPGFAPQGFRPPAFAEPRAS